jgi:branched-chain amino acid transport system substrate-binding protein
MNQPSGARSSSGRGTAVAVAIAAALLLVSAGCGTRQSRDEVAAAARGSQSSGESVTAGGAFDEGSGSPEDVATNDAGTGAGGGATVDATPGEVPGAPDSGGTSGGAADAPAASGGGAPAGGGGAANGTPIVIGNVSTTSGIPGVAQVPAVRALQAWVAMTNAGGGINGHPIRLVLADDASDPARHAAAVKDLVENKGVIAFVSMWASQTIHASRSYLEQKRIPVIGGDSSSSNWFESPMLFPQGPTPDNFMRGRLKVLASVTNKRKIATMVCRESAVCREQAAAVKKNAAEFGFSVVYEGQASLAQPDFTAECISARNAGAELILPTFEAASMRRIAQSCDRQSYRPIYDLVTAIEDDFPKIPAFDGAILSHHVFPTYADSPPAKQFRDALAKYAPNQPPLPVAGSGWATAVVFGKAAAAAFPPDAKPSSAPLLDALWSMKNETAGGLTGPLTFVRDQPGKASAPRCVFPMRVEGGRFVAPQGMTPTCV